MKGWSNLVIHGSRIKDSGNYSCQPNNALHSAVQIHVVTSKLFLMNLTVHLFLWTDMSVRPYVLVLLDLQCWTTNCLVTQGKIFFRNFAAFIRAIYQNYLIIWICFASLSSVFNIILHYNMLEFRLINLYLYILYASFIKLLVIYAAFQRDFVQCSLHSGLKCLTVC